MASQNKLRNVPFFSFWKSLWKIIILRYMFHRMYKSSRPRLYIVGNFLNHFMSLQSMKISYFFWVSFSIFLVSVYSVFHILSIALSYDHFYLWLIVIFPSLISDSSNLAFYPFLFVNLTEFCEFCLFFKRIDFSFSLFFSSLFILHF